MLLDLEWIEFDAAHQSITQIAALRVGPGWGEQDRFTAVLRPAGLNQCDPSNMALNGYPLIAFQEGEAEKSAMTRVASWLRNGDVIYVWQRFSRDRTA